MLHLSNVHRVSDPRIRLKQCRTLAAAGAAVTLVARASPVDVGGDTVEIHELEPWSGRVRRVVKGFGELLAHARRVEPDVIHFHDPELLALAPLLRRHAPVVIYDVHESLPDLVLDREWIPASARRPVGAVLRRIEPLLVRACSGAVLVDPSWATRLGSRPWASIGNPPLRAEARRSERNGPPAPPHIVYVGELLAERGVHDAVRALGRLPDDHILTLAGPVAPALAAELRELDDTGRLELPGLLGRDQVLDLLDRASVGLVLLAPVPAYDTAVATKIHEYAAAGLPMVLSSTTAHRRIAGESGAAVVVPYGDLDALVDALIEIHERATWLRTAAAAGRLADRTPSWEDDEAGRLVDFYRRLLDRG